MDLLVLSLSPFLYLPTGLFTADQRLRSNNRGVSSAIYTRQNPNGNQDGFDQEQEIYYMVSRLYNIFSLCYPLINFHIILF